MDEANNKVPTPITENDSDSGKQTEEHKKEESVKTIGNLMKLS